MPDFHHSAFSFNLLKHPLLVLQNKFQQYTNSPPKLRAKNIILRDRFDKITNAHKLQCALRYQIFIYFSMDRFKYFLQYISIYVSTL